MHIKKGDTVKILSGDEKGKTGKVSKAFPATNQIIIEGLNTVKKHQRPTKQGQKGQVINVAMPFNASKAVKVD